jgi:hypothetical protein
VTIQQLAVIVSVVVSPAFGVTATQTVGDWTDVEDGVEVTMTAMKDVREMTVRELCELAEEIRTSPAGSTKLRRAADRMAEVAWALQDGPLAQMLWWAGSDVVPQPPPDTQEPPPGPRRMAKVVEMQVKPGNQRGGNADGC